MSQKSGFFYLLFAWMSGLFSFHESLSQSKYQPRANRIGGGGEITSYGKKPVYSPLHPKKNKAREERQWMKQYDFSLQGLFWDKTTNRVYWNTHQLAVDHQ